MVRIAVLTTRLFDAPRSGGEICTARLLAALRPFADELLVAGRGLVPACRGATWMTLGPTEPAADALSLPRRAASLAAAVVRRRAWTVQRLVSGGVQQRVAALLARHAPQLLVLDHLHTWAWLQRVPQPWPPLLLVAHNLEAAGYREQHDALPPAAALRRWVLAREARQLQALEAAALARVATVACLSDADADAWRAARRGIAPPIEVLPGYPLAAPHAPRALDGRRRIGVIGTWTWAPNRQALDWLLADVLPRLPAGCELVLAGSGLDPRVLPATVCNLGVVERSADFYAAVDVVAVPSLSGSGVQEKAIDAIGSGRSVVATPHALRGLAPLPPSVHAAADAQAFAQLCATVPAAGADTPLLVAAWSSERQSRHAAALARCIAAAALNTVR